MSKEITAGQMIELLKSLPADTPVCFHCGEFDSVFTNTGVYELTRKADGRKYVLLGSGYGIYEDMELGIHNWESDDLICDYQMTRTLLKMEPDKQ